MSDRLQSHGVTSRMRAKALRKQTKPLLASLLGAQLDALYENAMVHYNASRFLPSFMQGLGLMAGLCNVMISIRGQRREWPTAIWGAVAFDARQNTKDSLQGHLGLK